MSFVTGVGLTAFGAAPGQGTLDLMGTAATAALVDAGLLRDDIDGLVCGYSTTLPHLMLSTVFAEHFGLRPRYAHGIQLGGATGFAMVMLAHLLIKAGAARHVLVVGGENRLTGQTRDASIQTLAQVGHPVHEVPLGATVPAYYALIAARYLHETGAREEDLAELPVLMRRNAARHPGAHLRQAISVAEVMASRAIATPLKMADCCPISDGGAAFVLSRDAPPGARVRITGAAQAHSHQHISVAASLSTFGAGESASQALTQAGIGIGQVGYAAIYDSFSITLAVLLEEIGFAPRGAAGACARGGLFGPAGAIPLNTHGGLLGYGHCGVAGAMAHLVEAQLQMTGRAGERQVPTPARFALLHGDGGVLSSHVSLVLERAG